MAETKEQKEKRIDRIMAEMKKKNEQIEKRRKEVLEDEKKAAGVNKSVSPKQTFTTSKGVNRNAINRVDSPREDVKHRDTMESQEYLRWKSERETIDKQRLDRQKKGNCWAREWDRDEHKIPTEELSPQRENSRGHRGHNRGSPRGRGGQSRSQIPDAFDKKYRNPLIDRSPDEKPKPTEKSSDQRTPPSQKLETQKRRPIKERLGKKENNSLTNTQDKFENISIYVNGNERSVVNEEIPKDPHSEIVDAQLRFFQSMTVNNSTVPFDCAHAESVTECGFDVQANCVADVNSAELHVNTTNSDDGWETDSDAEFDGDHNLLDETKV